jgi:hypothetical protein
MSNSKICILDHNSLAELNNSFEYAADSVLKVREAVNEYLNGVIKVMESQLERVVQRYETAKENLKAARGRLDAVKERFAAIKENMTHSMDGAEDVAGVIVSATYGAASAASLGVVGGLVAAAQADYERAQRNYDKWEKNYNTAKEVLQQCKTYKSDWEYQNLLSWGGDFYLEMLGKNDTDSATEKLRRIIEVVEKYLNVSIVSNRNRSTDNVEVLNKEDKRKIQINSEKKVRNEQIYEMNYHNIANANRVAKCKECGRPLSICVCRSVRKNIELL